MDWGKFNWGNISKKDIDFYKKETEKHIYEKYFQVEENDIVVDIGSSNGIFTLSILDKKPLHCWCIEPDRDNFILLFDNLKGHPVSFIRGAISNEKEVEIEWVGKYKVYGIKFQEFVQYYCIDKIDFLKIDCEGGEYLIFTEENVNYLKNVKKIAIEFHLRSDENKKLFRNFRDNILPHFKNFEISSQNNVNIKWDLHNEHFIEWYKEILIYIDNRNDK